MELTLDDHSASAKPLPMSPRRSICPAMLVGPFGSGTLGRLSRACRGGWARPPRSRARCCRRAGAPVGDVDGRRPARHSTGCRRDRHGAADRAPCRAIRLSAMSHGPVRLHRSRAWPVAGYHAGDDRLTPGSASAAEASIEMIRACACGPGRPPRSTPGRKAGAVVGALSPCPSCRAN